MSEQTGPSPSLKVCRTTPEWQIIKKAFPVLEKHIESRKLPDVVSDEDLHNSIAAIKKLNLELRFQDIIVQCIEKRLKHEVAPRFWAHFKVLYDDQTGFSQFVAAVEYLYFSYGRFYFVMTRLQKVKEQIPADINWNKAVYSKSSEIMGIKLVIRAAVLTYMHLDYQWLVRAFYEGGLKMEDPDEASSSTSPESKNCIICSRQKPQCECAKKFEATNSKLRQMTLLDPLCGQTLTNLTYAYIHSHIQKVCKGSFDTSQVQPLEEWLEKVVMTWLKKIYYFDSSKSSKNRLDEFNKKLTNYLYNTYTRTRIDQLFNIIIEYPESIPALEDLKRCVPKTELTQHLLDVLQKAVETRLLHPGVSTSDILTAYIAAIRSMRVLDPSGILLETITQPFHQYLRGREDTVRCVVSSLTEEDPNDLAEELVKKEAEPDEDDEEEWESWEPDPVEAREEVTIIRRTDDIITILVNVYGNKELFVNEYRTLLADRVLSQNSSDTEKEIRYLEHLKLRFGDSQLHYCEVMLKDIADSKRINQNIKQDVNYTEEDIPMSAMIVSAQFWPAFKDEKLELHKKLVKQMETYTKSFETLKGSRTLCWKNHLGIVDLDIELADRTLSLSVSPVHATILMHFQDQKTWTLEALSKLMHVPPTSLRRKLSFWQSHAIIAETETDVFILKEEQENSANNIQPEDIVVEDYESESAMASSQDQREEELQTFWSYIVGMLMNLDTLSLDRIHQMLKMFAFQGPTIECSLQELKVFLDRKVREHLLIYSNGLYRLPK